jgi:hypothetical protein
MNPSRTMAALFVAIAPLAPGRAAQSQATSTAKVCGLLPMAALEAHFGQKASSVRGSETPSVSMCAVDIQDRRHGVNLVSQREGPVSVTVQQRLAAIKPMLDKKGARVQDFGDAACYDDDLEMGDNTTLPAVTCFLDKGGYLSLTARSDDRKQLSFDVVKDLLEKTAAKRK